MPRKSKSKRVKVKGGGAFLELVIHFWSTPSAQFSPVAPSSCNVCSCHNPICYLCRWPKPRERGRQVFNPQGGRRSSIQDWSWHTERRRLTVHQSKRQAQSTGYIKQPSLLHHVKIMLSHSHLIVFQAETAELLHYTRVCIWNEFVRTHQYAVGYIRWNGNKFISNTID